jgi:hypothetical protein
MNLGEVEWLRDKTAASSCEQIPFSMSFNTALKRTRWSVAEASWGIPQNPRFKRC